MRPVQTSRAPAALGPYSQATISGDLVFSAGCIGLEPSTGELVEGGIGPETRRSLANLSEVLKAAGSGMDRVLREDRRMQDHARVGDKNQVHRTDGVSDLHQTAVNRAWE